MSGTIADPIEFILGRRSIRSFLPGEIDATVVRKILEAAMAAPSAMAKDPWRFVVVRDRRTLLSLSETLSNGKMLVTAALGIVVCGDIEVAHDRQLSYLLQDCSAAIENMLLAIHGLGLGGCWLGIHPRVNRITHVRSVLGLPDNIIPVACIAIGHPAEKKEPRTRYNETYVHYDRW